VNISVEHSSTKKAKRVSTLFDLDAMRIDALVIRHAKTACRTLLRRR